MNTRVKNQLKKVQLKWNKLQWYSKTLILVGLIGLLYYVIKEYYLLIFTSVRLNSILGANCLN